MNDVRRLQACAQSDHEPAAVRSQEPGQVFYRVERTPEAAAPDELVGPWGRPFVELTWDGRQPVLTEIPAERAIAGAWRL